jgi:predicted nucleic acid-binding protein
MILRSLRSRNHLFQYIAVVPVDEFHRAIEEADAAIGDTDPDDVLYLARAITNDAAIRSGDSDFGERDVVETYSTRSRHADRHSLEAGSAGCDRCKLLSRSAGDCVDFTAIVVATENHRTVDRSTAYDGLCK